MRRLIFTAGGLILVAIAAWYWLMSEDIKLPPGVALNDYQRVAQSLQRTSRRTPGRDEVFFKLADEYATNQKWDLAAALFAKVPDDVRYGRQARYLQAQCVLQLDRLRESEQLFREYLADTSTSTHTLWPTPAPHEERVQALHYLSYLLSVELRFDERKVLLGDLVQRADADLFDTLACHFQPLMEWNNTHGVERLERACAVTPNDWQLQSVLAQYRIAQGRTAEAWKLLQQCREQRPDDLNIAAACLTCLEEQGDTEGYLQLGARLPPIGPRDPVNLLRHRGQLALRRDRASEATTCFQQALAIEPSCVSCRLGLAEAWLALKEPEQRKKELSAAENLARIQNRLGWAASKTPTPEVLLEIIRLSADAGLQTAAVDLCKISIRHFKESARFEALLRKVAADKPGGANP